MAQFIQSGCKVKVYDLSPIINPIAYKNSGKGLLDECNKVEVKHVQNIKELKTEATELKDVFFWSTIPLCSTSYKVFKIISRWSYGFICNVDYVPAVPRTQQKDFMQYLKSFSWMRMRESIFSRIPRKLLPLKKADAILTYTNENIKNITVNVLCGKSTRVELVNTLDYNEYAKCEEMQERLVEQEYCLFIDQFIPFHPDGKAAGYHFTAQLYYEQMTTFLKKVEEITKLKMIIAAHPKANYDLYPEFFADFDIYRFKTCQLVKDAKLVVSHASISLSFVVLFKKPLLLVATNEMLNETRLLQALENASISVQHEIINVSEDNTLQKLNDIIIEELRLDTEMYEKQSAKYKLDITKYENANKSFYEVMNACMERV